MTRYFMGIDVGTGSARAGIFDESGKLAGHAQRQISIFHEPGSIVEQSSDEIWSAVSAASREAIDKAGVATDAIHGIGFDATCSLVVLGEGGRPLPVGPSEDPGRNIIVWMDHRAVEQAERINHLGHSVLGYVGSRISPEMETPKLLWLSENRPQVFRGAWQFFDLTDFLTWKSTGSLARSTCTVTCKWTYLAHENRWDETYFRSVGLGELAAEGFRRIGTEVIAPGTALGDGLTEAAAKDLGLTPGTPVAAGLIDAHAGGVGTVGAQGGGKPQENMAYVFGTSSCTMTTTSEPVFVPGVWGPYYSAMVPGTWLLEGGQSAAGAAIEQLLKLHPAHAEARALAGNADQSLPEWLSDQALAGAATPSDAARRAAGLMVVPEFIGNRAPHADPYCRAVIAGLGTDADIESLVHLYVAGICGIGYGLRQIVDAQSAKGASVKSIVLSGGAGKSPLVRHLLADTTGMGVAIPGSDEPVLLGSAILGAVAAGVFASLDEAMSKMSSIKLRFHPTEGELRQTHDKGFELFERFQNLAGELAVRT